MRRADADTSITLEALGPTLTPESVLPGAEQKMNGSVLIAEASSIEEVREIVEGDVYYTNNVVSLLDSITHQSTLLTQETTVGQGQDHYHTHDLGPSPVNHLVQVLVYRIQVYWNVCYPKNQVYSMNNNLTQQERNTGRKPLLSTTVCKTRVDMFRMWTSWAETAWSSQIRHRFFQYRESDYLF